MKKKFKKFLKKHEAWEAFKKNYDKEFWGIKPDSIESFFKSCDPEDYMTRGFHWSGSIQGYMHWAKLNRKWRVRLNSRNHKKKCS